MLGWIAAATLIQAAAGERPAAEPAVPATPAALVSTHTLTHPGEKIRVRVPSTATYAGGERFNLYGVADAEVHVFIEAGSDKRMQRLYWVQFESYLPSNDHRYDYADGNRPIDFGGARTWLRSNPVPTTGPVREGSDREAVYRILKRGGYAIPAEVMNVRLVQMLDDPAGTGKGRRELMLIYSEDLALSGKTLAELTADGKPNARWPALEGPLIARATSRFRIERL